MQQPGLQRFSETNRSCWEMAAERERADRFMVNENKIIFKSSYVITVIYSTAAYFLAYTLIFI